MLELREGLLKSFKKKRKSDEEVALERNGR